MKIIQWILIALIFLSPYKANASRDSDSYDGNIFPIYAGNGAIVPPQTTLHESLKNKRVSVLFFYLDDSSDSKAMAPIISGLDLIWRNNINNYNRWHDYIYMPIYLYESKREYIDIIDKKFTRYFKNENREKELENLEWLQKQVTLLVEIRDAVAPQLEVAVKYIGNLFVTFLTKVVGKAIGLVGKGILQGLGRSSSK